MAFDEISTLIEKLRILESTDLPTEEAVTEEPITKPDLNSFIDSLNEDDEGVAEFGPFKIYYQGENHNFLGDGEEELLQRFVNRELPNFPKSYGYINEGKVFYALFSEDSSMEFAVEKTPPINPYGGKKDRQYRGAINEMPDTSGPVGVQPGGWRTYSPKPAGEFEDELDETVSTGLGGGSAGSSGGQMVGGPTTYEQEYDKFKKKGPRRITAMTYESEGSDKVTLSQLYDGELPEHNEMIWNFIGSNDLDIPFEVQTINPNKLDIYLRSQYRVEHLDELFDMMDPEQKEIVDHYIKDPNLSNQIIVMHDGNVIDGHHRAIAAIFAKKPIKFIDTGEE